MYATRSYYDPLEAIEYSLEAEKAGADATLHVAGYYNRPNQEGLYQHFKLLHDQTKLSYNFV